MLKIHQEILNEFAPIGKKNKIILFGSVAKGYYRLDSDIDLAIITDNVQSIKKSINTADKILIKFGKVVSLKFLTKEDMIKKDPFISEVLKGKVIYHGR